jgi:7-cyano-7-deazaguanine synthase in queuosine biosynthesis
MLLKYLHCVHPSSHRVQALFELCLVRDEVYLNWAVYYCMELLLHTHTRGDVVKLGAENLELIRSTWSCIHDSATHCGMCEGCLSRRKAFEQAEIPDPAL